MQDLYNVRHVRRWVWKASSAHKTALRKAGSVQHTRLSKWRAADRTAGHPQIETQERKYPLHHLIPPKVISEPDPATGHFDPFPAYSYTGTMRPVYPLSARRTIPDRIPHPDYAKDGIPRSEQMFVGRNKITILDKKQQEGMRKVCKLGREVLDLAAAEVKPGVTTDHIDEVVHKACIERDVSTASIVHG